ncbi:MAG TPA: putative collagen-binding domain-containing protein, partial [Thermoanaerobaculia bacterium]|nr:putative collagen-binding domain-containing protein [Thermoanaerobaculia bacterium]
LIKYGMARLSGYVNTMFVLALEWQEGWTTTEVGTNMTYLHSQNPWARLATVHGVPGDFSYPSASWADYMDTQAGNEVGYGAVHSHGLRNRALAAKPVIQEEFGLGQEDTAHRQKAWAAFTAGAAGVGTGSFLRHLANFVAQIDFERMDPADSLATSANAYVLAEKGIAYVVYAYNGGTVRLDLRGVSGSFTARWYDPRTGTFGATSTVSAGVERSFTAPGGGDWVLHVQKATTTTSPPPPITSPPLGPNDLVTRDRTAFNFVQAMHGQSFVPPASQGIFADVSRSSWAASFVEQLYADGITTGCAASPLRFCPGSHLNRAEMAVLLLRARHGRSYVPPAATGRVFTDVPASFWAAAWIERLYAEGITTGCAPGRYCPGDRVTLWQLETFLARSYAP